MKVWVFVEGKSDKEALSVLWNEWRRKLRNKGWGIQFIPLENKSKYLKKIGARAAEKLLFDVNDLVVGLPDLYPNQNYVNTEYKHDNLDELAKVQMRLVKRYLQKKRLPGINRYMNRFYSGALSHDLEMLLLAVPNELKSRLGMSNKPSGWQRPPEEQNQNRPPKKIIQKLFLEKLRRSYKETVDSHAILSNVSIRDVLFDEHGRDQCPAFRAMLDWIGDKTGVQAYNVGNAAKLTSRQ